MFYVRRFANEINWTVICTYFIIQIVKSSSYSLFIFTYIILICMFNIKIDFTFKLLKFI